MDPDAQMTIEIRDLNPHIVCILCAGYFIDATTITECLHTFCKSCIVKYLQTSKFCPNCNSKIHETQPLINLRSDRTLQDIVFKLVPHLAEAEEERRKHFYKSRGLDDDQNSDQKQSLAVTETQRSNGYHTDEEISLCIEPLSLSFINASIHPLQYPLQNLSRRYLRCSSRARVGHVIKLVAKISRLPGGNSLEMLCQQNLLSPYATLKSVFLRYWLGRGFPLVLQCVVITTEMKVKALKEEARLKKLKRQKETADAAAAAAVAAASSAASAAAAAAAANDGLALTALTDVEKKPDVTLSTAAAESLIADGAPSSRAIAAATATLGINVCNVEKTSAVESGGGGGVVDDITPGSIDPFRRRESSTTTTTTAQQQPQQQHDVGGSSASTGDHHRQHDPSSSTSSRLDPPPPPLLHHHHPGVIPFKKEIVEDETSGAGGGSSDDAGGDFAPVIKKEIVDNSSSTTNSNPPPELSEEDNDGSEQRSSSSPSSSSFPAATAAEAAALSSRGGPLPPSQMLSIVPATTSTRAVADSTCP